MIRKFLAPLVAALAIGGAVASPALAGNNAQDSTAWQTAKNDCIVTFPNTCFGITKVAEGLCLGPAPGSYPYCNYYYRYYGYYGSRKVRCEIILIVRSDYTWWGAVAKRDCYYA